MTKWYAYELISFLAAIAALILGFSVNSWFLYISTAFGGGAIAFSIIEDEAERYVKRRNKKIARAETEAERQYRELGYKFMLEE